MRRNTKLAAILAIVILVFSTVEFYTYDSMSSQLSTSKSSLDSQISALKASMNSLSATVASLQNSAAQNQQSSTAQQVASMQSMLQTIQSKLASLSSSLNSTEASGSAFQAQTLQQVQNLTASIQALSSKLTALTPQVPLSTLVIVGNSYDNASNTFEFIVHNTQTFTVYAQLSATLWGTNCLYYNSQGTYLSSVYTFGPLTNTTTTLNLSLAAYQSNQFCGHTPVVDLTMSYVAAPSTAVSQTYTFDVTPYYAWQ